VGVKSRLGDFWKNWNVTNPNPGGLSGGGPPS
jgi:hypothetical protein